MRGMRDHATGSASAARRSAQPGDEGRGAVFSRRPRPLCDRRVHLPDRARRRSRAAHDRGCPDRDGDRARERRPGPAARRRHQPMRPDGQSSIGARLLEISPQRAGDRPRSAPRRGRAGRRAQPSQRGPEAAWPVLSGRSVDACPLHHRRHGGQQFLRQQVDPLRADGRQCRGDRRDPRRRHAFPLRSRLARTGRDDAAGHRAS